MQECGTCVCKSRVTLVCKAEGWIVCGDVGGDRTKNPRLDFTVDSKNIRV